MSSFVAHLRRGFAVITVSSVALMCFWNIVGINYGNQDCFFFCQGSRRIQRSVTAISKVKIPQFYSVMQDCTKPEQMQERKYRGKLNVHRWFDSCPCGHSIDRAIRIHSKFPAEPEFESTINSSEVILDDVLYSQRIFGYITPEVTGSYRFAVSSDDNSELWISSDSSPKNVVLVASVGDPYKLDAVFTGLRNFNQQKSQQSKLLNLTSGQDYYIEVLHRNQGSSGHVSIAWQTPASNTTDFTLIEPKLLSLYMPEDIKLSENLSQHVRCIMEEHLPLALRLVPPVTPRKIKDERDDICLKFHILDHSQVADVLKTCPYDPTYKPRNKVNQFEGVGLVRNTDVYPDDKTSVYFSRKGNTIIDKQEVEEIVNEYMNRIKRAKGDSYKLKKILNVEKKHDSVKGTRYLLELELGFSVKNDSVRLSEYVYKFNKEYTKSHSNTSTDLCYPEGLVWSKDAKIYLIIPVKNYGYWVKYLIDELVKIYTKTNEKSFHLVIIDFNSTDFQAEKYLQKTVLNNSFTFLKKSGRFFKTAAINDGVATVKDPNSIIFLMDLHITIPTCFFDVIRKHTVKGKLGFFPILLRLDCSSSESYPQGHWEGWGYGLFGTYKQDWDSFGGENVEKFRYQWGGEDWDLLDRVLNAKIEAERFRWQKLFHFPHSKIW